ncbi:AP-1 complex subunit gamma-2-like isoform X2 [Musa acuminata AAA Group]|uniref:AP-1 complex subunit gamma-2-like isoform X2 n=1 Tax=Musa acuminata AAA Group TaxID=214697 RepID=UPI0031CF3A24
MNPFSSPTRLRDMIQAIRACKTAAEERAVVRKECAAIRSAISENDQFYRHRNLAKLMFIHMLGYPTHFGQLECLKLIAAVDFPEKRIGYLGLMLLLDERQEVLMLVTNSLKQDLNHSNQYIVGLALCALGNICSVEMAMDLAPEVERLLLSRDQTIKKKAALCSIRIIRKVSDLAENLMSPAASLLKEKHHGVLIAGVQLCTDLCKVSASVLEYLRKTCIERLIRILKDISNSSYSLEYDIAGTVDPFLHIRVLKLMRILGQGDADSSEYMIDILAQVASKTESKKNAGNAVLYECVETIMGIEATSGLRVLAVNILGRFLSNHDNNIRYVALNMLMKAVTIESQAVQRHRTTILERVKDSDASIQKRALDLVFLLVNETNVKPLTKELIDYLEVSDQDFKGDLTAKICSIVDKFSQEKLWYTDQMFKVLCLVTESDAVDVLEASLKNCSPDITTQSLSLIALLKLSSRFPPTSERIREIIMYHKGSVVLELQQRAIEFNSIIQRHQNIKPSLLERMPVLDEMTYLLKKASSSQANVSADKTSKSNSRASLKLPNGVIHAPATPDLDLLDLSSDDNPANTSSSNEYLHDLLGIGLTNTGSTDQGIVPSEGTDILMDLLSIGAPTVQNDILVSDAVSSNQGIAPATKPSSTTQVMDLLDGTPTNTSISDYQNPVHPSIIAFQSNTLMITFTFTKQADDPKVTQIQATFTNLSSDTYTDFVFQAAVPKFIQLQLDPASSNFLPANSNEEITQSLTVTNTQHGQKALAMRMRIAYKVNNQDVLEQGQVNNFPPGL